MPPPPNVQSLAPEETEPLAAGRARPKLSTDSESGSPRSVRNAFLSLKNRMSFGTSRGASSHDVSSRAGSAEEPKSLEQELDELNLAPPNYKRIFTPHKFTIETVENKRKNWAMDLILTPNNGIRAELNDLYNLFSIMEKRPLQLDAHDVELLFSWYEVFNKILENFFELEEVCLFEWIEGRDLIIGSQKYWTNPEGIIERGVFSTGRRKKRRGEILAIMREARGFENRFAGYPVLQILPRFGEAIEELVPVLDSYMRDKEQKLVEIITKRFTRKDRERYDYKFWSKIREMGRGELTLIAMMRWMSKKEGKVWLTKMKSLKVANKAEITGWMEEFETKHHGIVKECEDKLRLAIEEKKVQIEIHENARQRAVEKSKLSFIGFDLPSGSMRSEITLEESRLTSLISDGDQQA